MDTKDFQKRKNQKFIKYWEQKRTNKRNYTIKSTFSFSFIISIVYCLISYGFTMEFIKSFPLFFFISTIIYGLYVYFIEFNIQEKRYQKLKKEL